MSRLPLEGLRVLELAEGWAGPMSAMHLGDMGAEVIKIEAIQRMDHSRGPVVAPPGLPTYPNRNPGPRPYNVSGPYMVANRNKIDISLDMSRPAGVEVFKKLVRVSDIVVTNMVTGVPEKMGIGYNELRKVRRDIVMLAASGYGADGPYATRVTMAGAMDGIAGYMWLRNYSDQTPDTTVYNVRTDVVTGLTNALGVLMALYYRNKTGQSVLVEVSGVEASVIHIGEALMDYSMNRRVHGSIGNDHPSIAPHGCYRCKGDDRWVTIVAATDTQWESLQKVMGNPSWARREEFAHPRSRWQHREELNGLISAWTAGHDHIELMHTLQKAGVPAGAVFDNRDSSADPHYKARGIFGQIDHPDAGKTTMDMPSWVLSGQRLPVRRPPPCLAQHNDYVFREVLALSNEEVLSLEREKLIGTAPITANV